jgi:hypothetical protein
MAGMEASTEGISWRLSIWARVDMSAHDSHESAVRHSQLTTGEGQRGGGKGNDGSDGELHFAE